MFKGQRQEPMKKYTGDHESVVINVYNSHVMGIIPFPKNEKGVKFDQFLFFNKMWR